MPDPTTPASKKPTPEAAAPVVAAPAPAKAPDSAQAPAAAKAPGAAKASGGGRIRSADGAAHRPSAAPR